MNLVNRANIPLDHGNYLLNNWQNPRLRVVVSVRTNTQVDFFVKSISSESCHQPEEGIFGSLRHGIFWEDGGFELRHVVGNTLESCLGSRGRSCRRGGGYKDERLIKGFRGKGMARFGSHTILSWRDWAPQNNSKLCGTRQIWGGQDRHYLRIGEG
jgi:hypothetical protein